MSITGNYTSYPRRLPAARVTCAKAMLCQLSPRRARLAHIFLDKKSHRTYRTSVQLNRIFFVTVVRLNRPLFVVSDTYGGRAVDHREDSYETVVSLQVGHTAR